MPLVRNLMAPLSGMMLPIEQVPDPTFAQKMVGNGIAIDPTSETLSAPLAGVVGQVHEACHALTITTADGLEILMHIGLDTVMLKGQGFTPLVKRGQQVSQGQALINFDADFLARNAKSLITLMVITNGELVKEYRSMSGLVQVGRDIALKLLLSQQATEEPEKPAGEALLSSPITILNPAGIHARPAATLANHARQFSADITVVKDQQSANAKSVLGLMGLNIKQHDRVCLRAIGNDAQAALDSLGPLVSSGLGENLHQPVAQPLKPEAAAARHSDNPNLLLGVGASPGLVTGKVFKPHQGRISVTEAGQGAQAERERLLDAMEQARRELLALQQKLRNQADAGKAAIFAAHEELLDDPELLDNTMAIINQGKSAGFAWQQAYETQAKALAGLNNELLAARAGDIRDVGRRVLLHLTEASEQAGTVPPGSIIIARDLAPSDTAGLDKKVVLGFATIGGSSTSHASILARAAGIPAIAALEERALDISDGTQVILDGSKGQLILNPSAQEIEKVNGLQQEAARVKSLELEQAAKPAITLDGRRIKVVGNIGGLAEAEEIPELGGEGVGLLRSEFLFLQRSQAPGPEEQAAVYSGIARALGPQRDLVVRTLDVGGDKPLAYLPMAPEANPFLGIRGIRLNILGTRLFTDQVRAILAAAPYSRLHIMFPMVASIDELTQAREIVLEQKQQLGISQPVQIGIMVEVPSAAIMAEGLAQVADFFSIGTNDLTQYTLAMDRGHAQLAAMADALHPAVLNLIHHTVQGAKAHGKWVGVCGGLASEVLAVPALLGLGVDELSVSVASIPTIKSAVRRQNMAACQQMAQELLQMLTPDQVRARLQAFA